MKGLALVASVLLAMTLPLSAAEYQGKTIDGRRLPAQVYSYGTGGVFEAEVEFKEDLATVYFINGGQLQIRLNQSTIRDPGNIVGYGRVEQLPLGRSLSIGVGTDPGLSGSVTVGTGALNDTWVVRLLSSSPL
ncbi:hypothetical protein LEP3755_66930 (plasmid) [Leptolyngbya sp. NIES-3755]|nr:hypothetical protein LEP3755_66930 [Leptolyngbya sp. NIES-3755]